MVEIRLDEKDDGTKYVGANETVEVKKSDYYKKFEKVIYTIQYKNTYESTIVFFYFYSYLVYLYIKDFDRRTIYEYRVSKSSDIIYTVEAYYSKQHLNIPLVIKFQRKYDEAYYTYYKLKATSKSTGFPEKGGFNSRKLLQRLKEEDNRVNRVKFTTGGSYKNCKQETHQVVDQNKYVKHCYTVDNEKRYDDHVLTKSEIFRHEERIEVDDSHFKSVNEQYYDQVCVYCTNAEISNVFLVEFINGGNKTYFVRQDKYGYYWISKTIDDLNSELDQIQNNSNEKLCYFINKTHHYNGVTVAKQEHTSFDKYTHTPEKKCSDFKVTYLLHGSKSLAITKLGGYSGQNKLDRLDGRKFCDVCVYFIKLANNTFPVFIELTGSNNSDKYWLQKADPNCLLWKQIEDPQLGHAITYRLDVKHENGSYGNGSILVSKLPNSTFNAYSHNAQLDYKGKKSYITYRGNLISLEKINDIKETEKLDKIQEKKLSSVNVYYKKGETDGPPFFLELTEYSTKKKYCLLKVDTEGFKWKQLDNESGNINIPTNRNEIVKETEYYKNKSIIILANTDIEYPVNLVDNSISGIVTSETQPPTTNKITVKYNKESLSDLKYKSYEHSLTQTTEPESSQTQSPQTTTPDFLSNVSGLRIFIGSSTKDTVQLEQSVEIKLYSHDGNERKYLYYESNTTNEQDTDKKNKVYCYFYGEDNIPLMIYGGGFFYRPKSKNDYFQKWIQIQGIKSFNDKSNIATKLKDINKELNLIDLVNTKSYGLPDPETGQLPPDFSKDRITVANETPNNLFHKVVHSTKNNGPIGKICHGGSELKVVSEPSTSIEKTLLQTIEGASGSITTVTTTSYTTVCAYYHLSDSGYKKPLLIGIAKGSNKTPDIFFERADNSAILKWKKIESHESEQFSHNTKLAEKINKLQYNFNYSIKIKLENQGSDRINNYDLNLVKNIGSDTIKLSDSDNKITSDQNNCFSGTNYTCYTHTISLGKTSSSDVGGLRFYIGDKEIQFFKDSLTSLGKLFIYFNYNNFQVHVYFYMDGSKTDKVPLLVGYDGKYYGPKSKDDYFNQWVLLDGLGSTLQNQLLQKLTEINKSLNEVNISETTDGSSYGLKKPEPSNGIDDTFCNRISVQQDNNTFYNKLVHSTHNKGPIGSVFLSGKKISAIDLAQLGATCNKVEVYYHLSDSGYTRPLLIHITSQNNDRFCVKWYYRQDLQGTQWKDDTISQKYGSDQHIRDQLQLIQSRDSNFLNVELQNQENQYTGCITKGGDLGQKTEIGEIIVDRLFVVNTYKVDNYRCFHHKLNEFFNDNKDYFVSKLSLEQDPTLELAIYISNFKIQLNDVQNKSIYLYYSNEMVQKQVGVYVYFYESQAINAEYDKVPLLFMFNQLCFVPTSKETFYKQWKQIELKFFTVIGDVDPKKNLGAKLNQITRLLNQINLQTTDNDYGYIQTTKGPDTLKASPRVNVERVIDNTSYNTVTHSTEKTGCIGNVTFNTQNVMVVEGDQRSLGKTMLEDMEQELEKSPTTIYNSLNSYHHHSDKNCKTPLLIKISGSGSGSSGTRPPDLYYERANSTDQQKWKKVKDTSSLQTVGTDGITNKINQIFYNFTSSVKIKLEERLPNGGSTSYLAKLVTNSQTGDTGSRGDGKIEVSKDTKCSKLGTSYTCIKHTIGLTPLKIPETGGLRFYFGDKEVETFKDKQGNTKMPVFYQQNKNDIHVYLQSTTKVPLLFRYNSQCFKPLNKTNYFTKWVYDSGIKTGKPQVSKLDSIGEMLNEIDLKNTGNDGSGQQYGLDTPKDAGTLDKFDGNRITATRTKNGKFGTVTHTTIEKLGIGLVKYNGKDVTDNGTSQSKNLADAVKQDPSLGPGGANTVTVYYHGTDTSYSTPLMLGFASTNGGVVGVDTSTQTPKVFYERVDGNKQPLKWVKVQGQGLEELKKGTQDKIVDKLNEIRYNIGKSIVIYVDKQGTGSGGETPTEYSVQVVENKSGGRGSPTQTSGGVTKITVTKSENCTGTDSQPTQKYTCYTHTIPSLNGATESQYIGGLKFYACTKYLQTFGAGGHPLEPIYYNSKHQTVTVYFYSNGKGPPSSDTVPLLVKYGSRYYRPSNRTGYFDKWVLTQVSTEAQGDAENSLSTVIDRVNKDLNAIDLGQTTGAASGYGIYPNGGTACPCTDPATFCDRVSAKREAVPQSSQGLGGATTPTLFHRVTHTTTNGAGIGPVCYAGQLISAIKPGSGTTETQCVHNQVEVYYSSDDKTYTNPLLLCLCQQTDGQASEPAATNTQCKKWFKRNGIDITSWVEDKDDTSNYGTPVKIQGELQSIIGLFNDYLYLDIGNQGKSYDAYVQAKTGPKKQVQPVSGGGGAGDGDTTKIKVTDANTGTGSDPPVPDEYKGYRHKLGEFYNGAKEEIQKLLKSDGVTSNEIPEGSDATLHLRLQVGGQVIALFNEGGSTVSDPLTIKPGGGDNTSTNDPYVYFYKGNSGAGSSNPDWVPLLFQYEGKYFGPKDRHSYFHRWQQYEITDSADQTTGLKTQLDSINRQLNGIDLTQTGSGTSSRVTSQNEYGLPSLGAGLTGTFSATRITVKREEKVVSATSSYVTVTHTTTNGFNIGSIKGLGTGCRFDNTHTSALTNQSSGVKADQAVAVYATSDTTSLQTPSLVLIAESKSGLTSSSQSTVHGYYNLSSGCTSGQYKFQKLDKTTFTLDQLSDKSRVGSDSGLVGILGRIGIVTTEVQVPAAPQASSPDSADAEEDGDPEAGSEEDRDDNNLGTDTDRLGGSGSVSSGAKGGSLGPAGPQGPRGDKGETGEQGDRGIKGPPAAQPSPGPAAAPSSVHHTTPTNGHGSQSQQPRGGGGHTRQEDGETGPQGMKGDLGSEPNSGAQTDSGGFNEFIKKAGEVFKQPVGYGSASAVGGVGVIGGVGAVVYKK